MSFVVASLTHLEALKTGDFIKITAVSKTYGLVYYHSYVAVKIKARSFHLWNEFLLRIEVLSSYNILSN